eukprot:COSAG02_NODE_5434_length_4333_cov_4.508266_3_plen_97_part_00
MLLADSEGPESAIEESSAIWAETTVGILVCMLNGVHTPCILSSLSGLAPENTEKKSTIGVFLDTRSRSREYSCTWRGDCITFESLGIAGLRQLLAP